MTRNDDIVTLYTSYFTSFLAYTQDLDWMKVGAVVLLVARLIQDVPRAIRFIKNGFNDQSK